MDMTSRRPYLVRAIYDWINDNGCTPFILVNTLYPKVVVPKEHINQDNSIILNVSPNAIKDLAITGDTFTFLGSFSGKVFELYIPMQALMAIYASENGQGIVFETEVKEPSVKIVESKADDLDNNNDKPPEPPTKKRPSLKVIK